MFDSKWVEITYICANSKCKAVDHDKKHVDDMSPVIPVINCWRCGAGRGMDQVDMIAQRRGMFAQAQAEVLVGQTVATN